MVRNTAKTWVFQRFLYILIGWTAGILIWQLFNDRLSQRPQRLFYSVVQKSQHEYFFPTEDLPGTDFLKLIGLDFKFTLLSYCKKSPTLLIILIHSAPLNFARRRVIRGTWGQGTRNVQFMFLIGSVISKELHKELEREQRVFGDIVQGNFLDSEKNATYKHVMGLKYVIYYCPQAIYILKTDDDVLVNVPAIKNFLTIDLSPYGANNLLLCSTWKYMMYPRSCIGWAVLYSQDVAFRLYREAQKGPYWSLEDVFITGTLAKRINVGHTNIESLVLTPQQVTDILHSTLKDSKPFLFSHPSFSEETMKTLWKYVKSQPVHRSVIEYVRLE